MSRHKVNVFKLMQALFWLLCMLAFSVFWFGYVMGCSSQTEASVCDPLETRCQGDLVQICDGEGRWQTFVNCSTTTPGRWVCTHEEVGHVCTQQSD